MGDTGEGLVDATSRFEERMEELQESRRKAKQGGSHLDPGRARALEFLRLAKADLERQLSTAPAVAKHARGDRPPSGRMLIDALFVANSVQTVRPRQTRPYDEMTGRK
jgi:uncharacterized membrane protein YccC